MAKQPPKFRLPPKESRCKKEVAPKTKFAKGSFRYKQSDADSFILLGCPKGQWSATKKRVIKTPGEKARVVTGRCNVPLKPHVFIETPKRNRCAVGYKRER
jgi:hypothetical protein